MEEDSLVYDDQNLIGRASSMKYVVTALTQRRCPDLTLSLDLSSCSNHPVAGGGFCDVYRGVVAGGVKVAIKTMRIFERPGKDNDKEKLLKRTARELYCWSQLRHPNVIPLMGLAMFRGHVSMISEWMDNGNLASYIVANPSANRMDLCIDTCAGLSYIHENNMVHGDLKAANVMVSASGTAMISDFGNAKLRDLTLKFTGTTNTGFSLRWAAPELFDEDNEALTSKKVDVYAYGMTVLETLTGQVPFAEFSDHQVMIMVAVKRKTPARPIAEVNDQLWQLLQECWAWEQSARPEITTVAERLSGISTRSLVDVGGLKNSNPNLEASSFRDTLAVAEPPLQPTEPGPGDDMPPPWIVDKLGGLQRRYSNIHVSAVAKPNDIDFPREFMLKCHDCPGKLYDPGPGLSLQNFEVHLNNRVHRANVGRRVAVQLANLPVSKVGKVAPSTPALGDSVVSE